MPVPSTLPILLLGWAAGWWAGRSSAGAKVLSTKPAADEPGGLPLEGSPPIPPLPPAASGGRDYTAMWDELDFDVEVYPAGADRRRLGPPAGRDRISVTPTCDAIAVGEAWWDRAGDLVASWYERGVTAPDTLLRTLLSREAPQCTAAMTEAAINFREEAAQRVSSFVADQGGEGTSGAGMSGVKLNRGYHGVARRHGSTARMVPRRNGSPFKPMPLMGATETALVPTGFVPRTVARPISLMAGLLPVRLRWRRRQSKAAAQPRHGWVSGVWRGGPP